MGAIYGFLGRRDSKLAAAMAEVLAHRGRQDCACLEREAASLGYRGDGDARFGAGLHVTEDGLVLALAGHVSAAVRGPDDRPLLVRLAAAYRERGIAATETLRGGYVLAIHDPARGELHLVRDGAGIRTVYWGTHQGRFLFASEPKGVIAAPGFPRRLRHAALAQYLSYSFMPGAGTMLADVHELPAGHRLCVRDGHAPRTERYFCFEDATAADFGAPDTEDPAVADAAHERFWTARVRERVSQTVDELLPAGEPVAAFLSGGLDSSIVTAELARRRGRGLRTYAIHFGARYPNELSFARAVAERWDTEHHEIEITPKGFLPRLRRIIWHLDDPIGDPITVPNFELAGRAAADVRVIFNGEGGDPLFGGPKNLSMLMHHWYGGIERGPGFRERMYLASYRRAYEEVDRLLTPELRASIDPQRDLESVLTPFFTAERPRSFLNKLMAINIRLKGAHLILPKVERMTTPWGITAMAPLFDQELLRMSFAMPPRLKLRGGIEKWVLKRAWQDDLPREVIERPKSGMRVPVHYWLQGEMGRYARRILSKRALRQAGIFDPQRVGRLLAYDTEEGPGRYGLRLWMLITFEIWRRMVIEGEPL